MTFDIKRLDIYRKVPKDLTQPTTTGAIISICCVVFMLFMLGTELVWFVSPDIRSELVVMNSDPTERIPVKINISIPRMKCEYLGIDIQVVTTDEAIYLIFYVKFIDELLRMTWADTKLVLWKTQ